MNLANIPSGMVSKTFEDSSYTKHIAKGNILKGMVFGQWTKIWNSDLPKSFTVDFEVYGEKAQGPENAEVDIFVAVN